MIEEIDSLPWRKALGSNMKRHEAAIDLISFLSTVAVATWQGWIVRDIIWGLWISSLLLGYAFIVASALSIYIHESMDGSPAKPSAGSTADDLESKADKTPAAVATRKKYQPVAMNIFISLCAFMFLGWRSSFAWMIFLCLLLFTVLGILSYGPVNRGRRSMPRELLRRFFQYSPMVVFMLSFFTVHFGGFHFVHGLFLNSFYPLISDSPLGASIGGTVLFFFRLIAKAIHSYWPFVLFSAVSRATDFKRIYSRDTGMNLLTPYANVVRMHIMIFVFAGLSIARLQTLAIYPVLIFYFLPAGSIAKGLFRARGKPRQPAQRSSMPR